MHLNYHNLNDECENWNSIVSFDSEEISRLQNTKNANRNLQLLFTRRPVKIVIEC